MPEVYKGDKYKAVKDKNGKCVIVLKKKKKAKQKLKINEKPKAMLSITARQIKELEAPDRDKIINQLTKQLASAENKNKQTQVIKVLEKVAPNNTKVEKAIEKARVPTLKEMILESTVAHSKTVQEGEKVEEKLVEKADKKISKFANMSISSLNNKLDEEDSLLKDYRHTKNEGSSASEKLSNKILYREQVRIVKELKKEIEDRESKSSSTQDGKGIPHKYYGSGYNLTNQELIRFNNLSQIHKTSEDFSRMSKEEVYHLLRGLAHAQLSMDSIQEIIGILNNARTRKRNTNITGIRDVDNLVMDYEDEGNLSTRQAGMGAGLYDNQINQLMDSQKDFAGTIPADKVNQIPIKPRIGWIMNTDDSSKPGKHWVAVYIDSIKDKEVDYYDSLGKPPTDDFRKQLKTYMDKLNPKEYLKLKINTVVDQKSNTDTCGYMAINFLNKRFKGISFKDATGYIEPKIDKSDQFEREANNLKSQNGFGFI